ncbi:MAG TPA: metalloregulator ArsR/SmtB family transcription factor [Candidatus Thermoplasmatota archaeon]|nr:metalloregulator ArsR/SmtB family transcription factor [Candidatus Thermoplasmatota archaeon]
MAQKVEPALAKRLEALTGEDGACCATDLRSLADDVAGTPRFQRRLAAVKALADEKRFLALALIRRRGAMCGCELQAALDLTHATVSHHMGVLVDAELIEPERRGKWVYYRLSPGTEAYLP